MFHWIDSYIGNIQMAPLKLKKLRKRPWPFDMVCEGGESYRIDEAERNKVVGGDGEGGDSGGGEEEMS